MYRQWDSATRPEYAEAQERQDAGQLAGMDFRVRFVEQQPRPRDQWYCQN